MTNNFTRRPGILVLHKSLDIIEAIRGSRSGIALSDLARSLRIPKPTAYRIMATLEARGYIARNQKGHYQNTRKFLDLLNMESDEQRLTQAALPVMEQLVESCRETVNLGILDAGEVVVIGTVESPQSIRMSSKVGNRRYLHTTALGKVLLSGLSDEDVSRLIRIKQLPRLTPRTLVTAQEVLTEIGKVRKQGFAVDNEENEAGGRCIGAPIVGPGERVVAALSISAPVFRLEMSRIRGLARQLTDSCLSISKALAFPA